AGAGGCGSDEWKAARAAAVRVPRRIDLHPVRRARTLPHRLRPPAAARERAVRRDVEHADVPAGGVVDEEPPAVQGEAEAVGAIEVVHQQRRALRVVAHAVHALEGELLLTRNAVELETAVRR